MLRLTADLLAAHVSALMLLLPGCCRMADIFTVLSTLREEVDVLEREIQTVEAALLADPDNKVLNRKYARLADEKKNKENRRERLEQQLTGTPTELLA